MYTSDNGQHSEGPAITRPGRDEVVVPYVVKSTRPKTDAGRVVEL